MSTNKLDVKSIQFLIQSFKDIVKETGKTDVSVRLFKRQSENMVYMGQIHNEDIQYVYRLLGMRNTDHLKWDISLNRLERFVKAMNYIICCKDNEARCQCLDQMLSNKVIDKAVYDYVAEIYDIRKKSETSYESFKNSNYGSFGTMSEISKLEKAVQSNEGKDVKFPFDSSYTKRQDIKAKYNADVLPQKQIEEIHRKWLGSLMLKNSMVQITDLYSTLCDNVAKKQFGEYLAKRYLKEVIYNNGEITEKASELINLNAKTPQELFMIQGKEEYGPEILQILASQVKGHEGKDSTETKFNRVCYLASKLIKGPFSDYIRAWSRSYNYIYDIEYVQQNFYQVRTNIVRSMFCKILKDMGLIRLLKIAKPNISIYLPQRQERNSLDREKDDELTSIYREHRKDFEFLIDAIV